MFGRQVWTLRAPVSAAPLAPPCCCCGPRRVFRSACRCRTTLAEAPPDPSGGRIKPTVGWLSTHSAESPTAGPTGRSRSTWCTSPGEPCCSRSVITRSARRRTATRSCWSAPRFARIDDQVDPAWHIRHQLQPSCGRARLPSPARPGQSGCSTRDARRRTVLGPRHGMVIASLPLSDGYHGVHSRGGRYRGTGMELVAFRSPARAVPAGTPGPAPKDMRVVDCDIGPGPHSALDRHGWPFGAPDRAARAGQRSAQTVRRMLLGMPGADQARRVAISQQRAGHRGDRAPGQLDSISHHHAANGAASRRRLISHQGVPLQLAAPIAGQCAVCRPGAPNR